ncbi:MAG TPA: Rne/Rng family ribonuclease [Firmicutes bacterium]|nr:Rne/Rng family ribonuclease [Bacillota bacterium]
MKKTIIISETFDELRIAVLEDGVFVEYYIESGSDISIMDNIYKGKVIAVNRSLKAVFVDIGLEKGAFLPFNQISDKQFIDENFKAIPLKTSIDPLKLKNGDEILVQIIKEPISTKGARLTTNISISGRYIVLMPNTKQIGISKKIKNRNERIRLFKIAKEIRPKEMGLILRTSAQGHSIEEIDEEVKKLQIKMYNIIKDAEKQKAPALIYTDSNLFDKLIKDIFSNGISECVIDSREFYEKLREYLNYTEPRLAKTLVLKENIDLFREYGIDKELKLMYSMSVPLPSGGNIVIQPTEALISIDVNSGKSGLKAKHEEMILRTNREAAKEIARQLRLRDLGGIIVIDFIDMGSEEHKKKLFEEFKSFIRNDKSKPFIFEMSPLGLIEMTRKRVRDVSSTTIYEPCNVCRGTGWIIGKDVIFMELIRWFKRNGSSYKGRKLGIICNEEFERYVQGKHIDYIEEEVQKYNIMIEFINDPHLLIDEVYIYDFDKSESIYELNRYRVDYI